MNQTQGNLNSIQPHVTLRKKDFEEAGIMMSMRASQTSFRRTASNMFDNQRPESAAKVDPMA
jgi:hypothetical protein